MRIFFLAVFAIYGGMHGYAFFRARAAFGFGLPAGAALAVFMLVMTTAPFLVRLLERYEYETAARLFSVLAYTWMGLLFLFFCVSLVFEASNLVLKIAGLATSGHARGIPPKPWFLAAAGLALVIATYGHFSALDLRTERITIATNKLPPGIDRLRIVQISDVHLGLIVRKDRLKRIADAVSSEKPDLLVSTGDLVDAQINHLAGLADVLKSIPAPLGKYAITGNHEFYAGLRQAMEFMESAGFTVLRDRIVHSGPIALAGVDDPAGQRLGAGKPVPEKHLLEPLPHDMFRLLLKHRPAVDPDSAGSFDLQLSGHTHKGQIFPFLYVVRQVYPLIAGTFFLESGTLHVSRGTGTWGPPMRVLSPPEITVIDLVRK